MTRPICNKHTWVKKWWDAPDIRITSEGYIVLASTKKIPTAYYECSVCLMRASPYTLENEDDR